jgi:hypothetical protein
MSEPLQSAYHPDADQISAFVEQALPAHEREQLLSHLAVCPGCRDLVALSLPELEAPAKPVATLARKPWWLGWTLALPLAGALATAVLTFVYFHPTPGTPVVQKPQIADAHAAPRTATSELSSALPARSAPPASRKTAASGAVSATPAPFPSAPAAGEAIGGPIVTGRNLAGLRLQSDKLSISTERGFITGEKAESKSGPGVDSAGAALAKAPAKLLEAEPRSFAANQAAPIASSAAPPPTAPATSADETVSVQNAAPAIDTVSADLSNLQIAQEEVKLDHPLPSHLAILSSATLGKRIVAIDSARNVFASKDSGKHWKQVPTHWQGSPLRASLIQPTRESVQAGMSSFATAAAYPVKPSPVLPSTLSGTVMDRTGAVIPGASVTATEIATGVAHAARSDAAGHYVMSGIPAGMYRIEAQYPGFRKQQIASVTVSSTGAAAANISLDVGEASQTVTVETNNTAVDTKAKKQASPQPAAGTLPLFQIVTDSGDHWTSSDGLHWNHE